MAEFQVITLKPEDWQLYKQIRLEALLNEPQAFGSRYADALQNSNSYWQGRLAEAQAGIKSWLLFVKEMDQISGMIGAYCSDDNDVVEIISVYVTKKKRGQGFAAALMEAMVEKVSKVGAFQKAILAVNADQIEAVALYQRFGFGIVEEKTGVLGDGKTHKGYIMEKELINPA
jgi:ribosomal protein S18 acetylase RimI-like enzyme